VVGGASQFEGDGRVTEFFERRHGERQDLAVITEPVDRAPASVEVDQGRVFVDPRAVTQDAVADRRSRGNRLHAGGVGRGKYVSEGIDLRHVLSLSGGSCWRDRMDANDLVSRVGLGFKACLGAGRAGCRLVRPPITAGRTRSDIPPGEKWLAELGDLGDNLLAEGGQV